jgi:hypothetical protein
MNDVILESLHEEKLILEAKLQEAATKIKDSMTMYKRFGDGSAQWRYWFDERFRLSQRLQGVEAEIRQITQEQDCQYKLAV